MWGFEGVSHKRTGNGVKFNAELAVRDDAFLTGKFKAKAHPFVYYYKFLKQFEDENTVADYVFAKENVDALYLEYDDARSGGFAPLAKVSPDKKVVLGLITTKSPVLEQKEDIIRRIHEAAKYIPLDRLYLSPQCGFASCEIGNKLTEEEQWAKLALVREIAEEVWGC